MKECGRQPAVGRRGRRASVHQASACRLLATSPPLCTVLSIQAAIDCKTKPSSKVLGNIWVPGRRQQRACGGARRLRRLLAVGRAGGKSSKQIARGFIKGSGAGWAYAVGKGVGQNCRRGDE